MHLLGLMPKCYNVGMEAVSTGQTIAVAIIGAMATVLASILPPIIERKLRLKRTKSPRKRCSRIKRSFRRAAGPP